MVVLSDWLCWNPILLHQPVYLLLVHRRCLPDPIDPNSKDVISVLNKTVVELEELVNEGQSGLNIGMQAKEVQLHVVIVCVCLYVLCFYFNQMLIQTSANPLLFQ